ncbi:MAG: hypothetical protein AB7V55_05105, partial [Oscillospiraceae bacterium]
MRKRNVIISVGVIVVLVALIAVLATLIINRVSGNDKTTDAPSGPRTLQMSGVELYILDAPALVAGDKLDYGQIDMEYCTRQDVHSGGVYVETISDERLPLTQELVAMQPGVFSLSPEDGTELAAGTLTITLQ